MFSQFGPVGFFCSELFRYGESRHDRAAVDRIEINFIGYFKCIAECFGNIGKDGIHLCSRLHPFLFGIAHTGWIIEVFACTEADQAVVRFGIFLIDKMDVVGGDQLHIVFTCQFDQDLVYFLLLRKGSTVGIRVMCLVPLHFQVIIFAEQVLEPKDRLFSFIYPIVHDMLRYFTSQAGRANDQVFMVFLQQFMIDTRAPIKTFRP